MIDARSVFILNIPWLVCVTLPVLAHLLRKHSSRVCARQAVKKKTIMKCTLLSGISSRNIFDLREETTGKQAVSLSNPQFVGLATATLTALFLKQC